VPPARGNRKENREMKNPRNRLWLAQLSSVIGLAATSIAGHAQTSDTGPQGEDPGPMSVDEQADAYGQTIVVTARRREEELARVPIAITALSGESIAARVLVSDADLQRTVPGLTIRQTQGNNSLTYSLRGQSADIFSGSPSAVISYVNEVPVPVGQASDFFDLESIAVLKGPQGTLFGRNATGGAVLFTTVKPTDKVEGFLRGRYGNYERVELEGALNLPLGEAVAVRGAFKLNYRDGFILNLFNGDSLGEIDRENARITIAIRPTETVTNTTMVQYTRSAGTNTGASYTWSVYAPGETNNGFALSSGAGFLFSPLLDAAFGPGAWAAYLARNPQAFAPGLVAYVDEQRRIGNYRTRHPSGAAHFGEVWTITNTTEIALSDDIRLRNIFGFVDSFTDSQQPQLGAPFATILTANLATGAVGNEDDTRSISEEIQLQGEALDGRLEYILGAYFQRQRSVILFPQTYFDLGLPQFGLPAFATNRFRIENDTDALYGQASYEVASGVTLTAGLRYTWETVRGLQLPGSDNFGPPEQSRGYSNPSWEFGVEYTPTDDLLLYAKTRGSFRSGGYNGTLDPDFVASIGASNFFGAETTEDVELGLKYAGRIGGRPLTFNLALYQQWLHDVQRVEFPDPDGAGPVASIAFTTNVPEERVRGIEAEFTAWPAEFLQIGGQFAWTDAVYTDNEVNLFGNRFFYGPVGDTPKVSGTVWAEAFIPVGDELGEVSIRGEVYAQSSQFFSNAANTVAPRTQLPGYSLVNARIDWREIGGSQISGALFAQNLLDKAYFAGGMQLAVALGHNAAVVGEPRMYGIELSFAF
jgi:iron complex outermembrane receptor protein